MMVGGTVQYTLLLRFSPFETKEWRKIAMSQGRYVWIAGKKVYLNPELQKEWDKLINKERYRLHQMLKYIREHRSTFCDF